MSKINKICIVLLIIILGINEKNIYICGPIPSEQEKNEAIEKLEEEKKQNEKIEGTDDSNVIEVEGTKPTYQDLEEAQKEHSENKKNKEENKQENENTGLDNIPEDTNVKDEGKIDIFKNAGNWFSNLLNKNNVENPESPVVGIAQELRNLVKGDVLELIKKIGATILIVAGVLLGVRYLLSAADGKAQIKTSLINYIVAVFLFYFAVNIYDLFKNVFTEFGNTGNLESVTNVIFYLVRIIAVGGVVFIGIRYMLSPADGKANLKKTLITALIGLILIYGITGIINLIKNMGNGLFSENETENNQL